MVAIDGFSTTANCTGVPFNVEKNVNILYDETITFRKKLERPTAT